MERHLREEAIGKRFTKAYLLTPAMSESLIQSHHAEIRELLTRNCRVEVTVRSEEDRKVLAYFAGLNPAPERLVAESKTKLIYEKPVDLGKLDVKDEIRKYLKKVENRESEEINM